MRGNSCSKTIQTFQMSIFTQLLSLLMAIYDRQIDLISQWHSRMASPHIFPVWFIYSKLNFVIFNAILNTLSYNLSSTIELIINGWQPSLFHFISMLVCQQTEIKYTCLTLGNVRSYSLICIRRPTSNNHESLDRLSTQDFFLD